MNIKSRQSLSFALMLLSALNGTAQSAPSQSATSKPDTIVSDTSVVLVPALVKTKTGAPVFTLNAGDFSLTDDGVEEKLALEEDSAAQPIALVVAIETGGLGAHKLSSYSKLGPLIDALVGGVPHQVALVGFDSQPTIRQGFTSDIGQIAAGIHELEEGDDRAAILDSLTFSVGLLGDQPARYRRAILLISETLDPGASGFQTAEEAKAAKVTMTAALRAISDTNTAIYALAFSSSKAGMKNEAPKTFGGISLNGGDPLFPAEPGPAGGCMARDPDTDSAAKTNRSKQFYDCMSLLAPPLRVAKMAAILARNSLERNIPETAAQLTGGEYFQFKDARGLERELGAIANHIPNRYLLSYHPQAPHPGLHSISLRLKSYPELVVAARTSYWSEGDGSGDGGSAGGKVVNH